MLFSYNRSAAKNPSDLLADLTGLMTGTLDFKTGNLSSSCNATKSTTSGSKMAKLPSAHSDNKKSTLAFGTKADPNDATKTIRTVTRTAVAATERWLKLQHPLYSETPLFGIGFDSANLAAGMYLKLAASAKIVIQALYGDNTSFVKQDGTLLAGDSLANGKLNVIKYNEIEMMIGARVKDAADLADNVKGVYTLTLPDNGDWYFPIGFGLQTAPTAPADLTALYGATITVTSDLKANAGKSVVLTLAKKADGSGYEWVNADKSFTLAATTNDTKSVVQSIAKFSDLYKLIGTIPAPVDADGDGKDDPIVPNYAGQYRATLAVTVKSTGRIVTSEVIADVAKTADAASRPKLNDAAYSYITTSTTTGSPAVTTTTYTEIYTRYEYANQPSQSAGNALTLFGDLSATATGFYIEFVVSNSGILFLNNNILVNNDQMFNNPIGIFYLESISVAEKGINVNNGVSMTGLGSLNGLIESTSTYNASSGEVQGEGIIYQGLVSLGSIGSYGTNFGQVATEAVGYSHNGALETSFLESYVMSNNFLYAKLYGLMRPLLTMNHARYELSIDDKEYVGFYFPALTAYNDSLANPASNLFGYIFK